MVQVIRPSQAMFRGPWLFDKEALETLDYVIDEQWKQLEAQKKSRIESAVRRNRDEMRKSDWYKELNEDRQKEEDRKSRQAAENDPLYANDNCLVTVTVANNVKVVAPSFSALAVAPECQDEVISKAEVRLVCGGVKVELIVPIAPTRDGLNTHSLSLVTLPEDSQPAHEAFVKFRMWAEEHRPDFLRTLNGLHPMMIILLMILFSVLVLVIAAVVAQSRSVPSWNDEARELVDKGVRPEDHGRALQLLLSKEVGGPNRTDAIPGSTWFLASVIVVGAISLLLGVQATTAFEIGKGKASVRWQKWYGRLLRRLIPSFLIMGVVASVIANYAFEFLRTR